MTTSQKIFILSILSYTPVFGLLQAPFEAALCYSLCTLTIVDSPQMAASSCTYCPLDDLSCSCYKTLKNMCPVEEPRERN